MANAGFRLAATGSVTGGENPGTLHSVSLTAGVDAATATVRYGGASGTVLLKLAAVAGTSAMWHAVDGIPHGGTLHVTLTGTAPDVTLEMGQ